MDDLKEAQKLDPLTHPDELPNLYSRQDGLVYYEGTRLYVPDQPSLKLRILKGFHDSPSAGHFRQDRTLATLKKWFFWEDMLKFVKEYIRTCDVCLRTKVNRKLPSGELMPIPVPHRPWSHITLDFITDLPPSSNLGEQQCYDSILVVVDKFTKMTHYIPTHKTLTSVNLAQLLLRSVFKHHGVPEVIISDQGSLFTSDFWRTLTTILGADHRLSTAFHPQTDGQTERQNATLEHYLRCYVDYLQTNWVDLLPLAKYVYNASPHATTQITPFYAYTGRTPVLFQLHPYTKKETGSPNAEEMSKEIALVQDSLKIKLTEAQDRQASQYNKKHRKQIFNKGDQVMLQMRNLRSDRPSKKLDHRQLGPFTISQVISEQAY